MKKISTLFICMIVSTCPMVGLTSDFQVGFAKTIITPGEEFLPINTGGYLGLQATGYRVDPSLPTGREELYARSMVLEWKHSVNCSPN